MSCFFSALLTWPWYVWGWWFSVVGLVVFVLFSLGYFVGADRYCERGHK